MNVSQEVQEMRSALTACVLSAATGVLHLGAHWGSIARKYSLLHKNVVWVEAIPDVFNELCRRIQCYPRQIAICALLDEVNDAERTFYISNNNNGVSSSIFDFGEYGSGPKSLWPDLGLRMTSNITLRTSRLDTLLANRNIESCNYDLWELDLQGSELNCLKGATAILQSATAIYAKISQVPIYEGGVLLPELESFLKDAGFVPLWTSELPHDSVLYIRAEQWTRLGGSDVRSVPERQNTSMSLLQQSYSALFDNAGRDRTFCAAPFIQIVLDPYGVAHPCGMRKDYPLGNLGSESIESIWNGDKMKSLRREFISGEVKTCEKLIRQTECNKCFSDFEGFVYRSDVQSLPPRRLDVRLNGRCNLECVMCNVWKEPNGAYDRLGFWTDGPEKIFPHLLEVCVLGGEPFVQKDTFRLIREVARVNKSCNWSFTTNCNWRLTPGLKSTLDLIRIRSISASIDSLKPHVYASIRKHGNLLMALQTVDDLVEYRKDRINRGLSDMDVCMRMVIRSDNFEEVPEFIDYARERDVYPDFSFQRDPPAAGGLINSPLEVMFDALNVLETCVRQKNAASLRPILEELRACIL